MSDQLKQELEALRERVVQLEGARSRRTRVFGVGVALAVVAGTSVWAANGTCPNQLPFCFTPNEPALASEVNHNFSQLKEWLENKVGPVTGNGISSSAGISTTGGINATNTNVTITNARLVGTNLAGNFHIDTIGNALYLNWFSGNGTTFGNGAQGQVARIDASGNFTNSGSLRIGNTGGNVPFGCVVRQAPGGTYNAACAANEIAVGGGGRCSGLWRLTESLPWGGPGEGDSPVPGQPPRAWRAVCQVWGSAGTYAYPQMGVFAVCCRQ